MFMLILIFHRSNLFKEERKEQYEFPFVSFVSQVLQLKNI